MQPSEQSEESNKSQWLDTQEEVKLHLPDGSVVLSDGRVMKPVTKAQPAAEASREIVSGRASKILVEKMSRKLTDLPDTPDKMNAFGALIVYQMLGVSDEEAALALGTTVEKIKAVKELDAFHQLSAMLDNTIIDDGKRAANLMLSKAATRATERMIDAVESNREDIAVVAARDVMKMAGVGQQEKASKRLGGLNIVIKRKGETDEEIRVEMTP
jgi:hypothetical protein